MRKGLKAALMCASIVGIAAYAYQVGTDSGPVRTVTMIEPAGTVTETAYYPKPVEVTKTVKVPGPVVTKTVTKVKVKTKVVTKTKYVKVRVPAKPKATGPKVTGSDATGYTVTYANGQQSGYPPKRDALAECVGEDTERACRIAVYREYAELARKAN